MSGLIMILIAAGLLLSSGLPACFCARESDKGQRWSCAVLLLGSLTGWCGLLLALLPAAPPELSLPGQSPWGGLAVELDALSAVFLVPVFTVPVLCAVYGLRYWPQTEHPDNGRGLCLFFGVLTGSMAMVVIARNAVLFLIFWEIMALAAYFLAVTEHDKPEVRRDGWIYLVASHAGAICLLALFALMRKVTGSYAFTVIDGGSLSAGYGAALFLLTVVGFGFKMGLVPLNIWLPAHAGAPGHVSAVMSGVMLKMGVYGLARILLLLPATDMWNGELLLSLGVITGVLGIAFAIGQRDIRMLLAYSSIENIGIITIGLGLALTGRTLQRNDLIILGLGAALLHVWNHSLFKSLLFLNASAVVKASQTGDMNRMGALAKTMPVTAGLFLFGAVAICGLPPLNGFASEWLLYMGLFRRVSTDGNPLTVAGIGAVALALIGALALACFVKAYSSVFLGQRRHECDAVSCDPPPLMRYPMALLAGGCVLLGLLPQAGLPLIRRAVAVWTAPVPTLPPALPLAPVHWIGLSSLALMLLAGAGIALLRYRIRPRTAQAPIGTWGCGYARPTPRMQYTGVSFAEMLVNLFTWVLRPLMQRPSVTALFPAADRFTTQVQDPVLTRLVLPWCRHIGQQMMKLRLLQQGRTDIYLLYILVMLLFLLGWKQLVPGQ
jgi:hydrogenase-4 component B